MDLGKSIRDFWADRVLFSWGSYDEMRTLRYETHPYMLETFEFDKFKDKWVLEIGCGGGIDSVEFAKHGAKVTSIDANPEAVKTTIKLAAKLRFPTNKIFTMDATNMIIIPSNSMDHIYSFGVLHCFPEIGKAIKEIYRVLKPGGTLYMMVYNKNSLIYHKAMYDAWKMGYFDKGLTEEEAFGEYSEFVSGCPYTKGYTELEVRQLLEEGFDVFNVSFHCPVIRGENREKIRVNIPEKMRYHIVIKARKKKNGGIYTKT